MCGSDGKDYNNQCQMDVTVCSTQKTITVVKRGKCDTGRSFPTECRALYDGVDLGKGGGVVGSDKIINPVLL